MQTTGSLPGREGAGLQAVDSAAAGARPRWPVGRTLVLTGTGTVLGLALGGLGRVPAPWAAVLMAVLVLAAGAVFVRVLGWSVGLVVLLVVTCLIDRNTFAVGRLNARPEQVAAVAAMLAFSASRLRARRSLLIRPNRAEAALLAWFAIALAGSALAPDRADSAKVLVLLLVSSLALFLPRRLLADGRDALDNVVGMTLLALAVEAGYSYLAYVLHLLGPTISIGLNTATAHLDAYGTLWEPNVLGAFTGAGAVAWTFLGPRHFKHSWVGVAICLSSCVASFARAAWLGVAIVVLFMLATPLRRRVDLRALLLGALGAAALTIGIAAAETTGAYTEGGGVGRSLGNGADILGRLYQFGPGLSDLRHDPIIGRGLDSFGQLHVLAGAPEHLTNLELLIAHDTGLLGLIAFAAFATFIVTATWRNRASQTVVGLAAALGVIAITNQATETTELMITWLFIGLLLAAVDAAGDPASARGIAGTAPGTGP
jgi:hypothetical protein